MILSSFFPCLWLFEKKGENGQKKDNEMKGLFYPIPLKMGRGQRNLKKEVYFVCRFCVDVMKGQKLSFFIKEVYI